MTDDWGIKSHTLDLRYRFELGNDSYLEPNVRFYTQTAADFYHYFLVQGQATPQFASADPRLGQFDATTFGIKYGKALSKDSEFSVRVEQYAQTGNSSPSEAIGQLKTQNFGLTIEKVVKYVTQPTNLWQGHKVYWSHRLREYGQAAINSATPSYS